MMEEIKIEGIVFDMDGVLFDTEAIFCKAWKQLAVKFEIPEEEKEFLLLNSIGLNQNDTRILFEERLGKNFPFEAYINEVKEFFKDILAREGVPVKKGVCEILEFLYENHYKIAIASSSSVKSIKKHLEESKLTRYFPVIIGGDMVEHSKPEPDIYLKACEALGVNPENSIAIEDSPNGIKAAYAAGMMPIMVPDLIQPDDDLRKLLFREMSSLLKVKEFLKNVRK